MKNSKGIGRRDFLASSAALVAGLSVAFPIRGRAAGETDTIEEAARKVGMLPRRKLGYSAREVSVIIGAADMPPAVVEAGILCGMNYWHKANKWAEGSAPHSIRKNRDAHYCQVNVDRAGTNAHTGRIDEDAFCAFVKESLKQTGLSYYDDMQFHFGYHNRAEIKRERGFVRAFERLKKEGLVKHLCISQHGYAGNASVPDGETAAEVLTGLIEDGLYEHAQFIYSFGAEPALDEFIALARRKGFGTIAMKTSRGLGRMREDPAFMAGLPAGASPHNALARWLTTATLLDAAAIRVAHIGEFVETYSGAGRPVRGVDARTITLMTERADRTACRLCTECQPHCPRGVPIAEILRFERYALDDRDWGRARSLYAGLERQGNSCVACGTCLSHCRQGLPIPDKMAGVHALLSRA
jgi:predicted aldo/keto reductase-like oxidoreductase